jgi:hypothetical protein
MVPQSTFRSFFTEAAVMALCFAFIVNLHSHTMKSVDLGISNFYFGCFGVSMVLKLR